jgi:Helix-turn-helix domain
MTKTDSLSEVTEAACESATKRAMNISNASPRRLLTGQEATVYLALSDREVYNVIAIKELKGVRHSRRLMVDLRDLEEWVATHKAESEMRRVIPAASGYQQKYRDRQGKLRKTATWLLQWMAKAARYIEYLGQIERVLVGQLLDLVAEDYDSNRRSSTYDIELRIDKHFRPFFGQKRGRSELHNDKYPDMWRSSETPEA